jgi:hypothetical protein
MLKEGTAFIQEKHKPINWKTANHIEKVDWLRTEIQNLQKHFVNNLFIELVGKFNLDFYCYNVQQYLCEARFWLGFEMERIKNEQ